MSGVKKRKREKHTNSHTLLGSISPTFWLKAFTSADPKSAERQSSISVFWRFGDLCSQKLFVKRWWNQPLVSPSHTKTSSFWTTLNKIKIMIFILLCWNKIIFIISLKMNLNLSTVKPVHNDHPWDNKKVVVVQKWSLLRG